MKTVLFNTHDLALIFTIFLCLLFSLFLVTLKKGKRLSHMLLATFLLTQAAIPLDNLIIFGEAFRPFALQLSPNLFYTFGLAYWLEAPLLLLYIRSIIYKDFKLKLRDGIYFLPFILFSIYFTSQWLILDNGVKLSILIGESLQTTPIIDRVLHVVREFLRCVFSILCLIELHRYNKHIKQEVADIESVDLTWLKVLVIGFFVIHINAIFVAIAIVMSYNIGIIVDHETLGLTSNYVVLFLITGLVFFSAGYSTIFKGFRDDLKANEHEDKEIHFDPQQIEYITQYMTSNKPYLNHLLTLENLANQLHIAPRQLSTIINRHFNKNFFEFINHYRIEESKNLLKYMDNRKATMLDIMDMAGFNSKATFNTFFKKVTGVTPTEYRKNYWKGQNNDV
ncbi:MULTISPECIES: helix-turn-helix domain-containing protein [Shewanella]|jgi:AraC-like DNA-binding protein|uniref:helix-turn-helix domain-containing protein n=1 Tax=Shewanella TaxID=22 RepID=UPI00200E9587|nr:AraC family transcriptional regulator [Shewanella basaltis]MCL1112820.1 helix-turn-helix domain-containing protein [Shewanella basaltis]